MSSFEEKMLKSSLVYSGIFYNLYKDKVLLPNSGSSYREYISHPGAVLIVPVFPNGDIILIKQYRYAVRQEFIEVPAGKVDKGEDIYASSVRELREETGYSSGRLDKIAMFYPCIGYSNEEMHLFVARDLSFVGDETDADEFVEPFVISLDEALASIKRGEILDMKTMLSLYLVNSYLSSE